MLSPNEVSLTNFSVKEELDGPSNIQKLTMGASGNGFQLFQTSPIPSASAPCTLVAQGDTQLNKKNLDDPAFSCCSALSFCFQCVLHFWTTPSTPSLISCSSPIHLLNAPPWPQLKVLSSTAFCVFNQCLDIRNRRERQHPFEHIDTTRRISLMGVH